MKLNRRNLFFASSATITLSLSAPVAQAADYYWDNNGTTNGFGTANGTWNGNGTGTGNTTGNSTQGWGNLNSTTLPTNIKTLTSDSLFFGNSTSGLANGTIAVTGNVSAGNMTFSALTGNITLGTAASLGNITLSNTSIISVANTTRFVTINSAIVAGNLTKAGAGTLILSGNNTYTGTTNVSVGTLRLSGLLGAGGTYAGNLSIASGATFQASNVGTQTLSGVVGFGGGTLSSSSGLILTNNANAYGTLNITGGRVFIQTNAGALSSVAAVNISGTGRLVTSVASTYNQAITVANGTGISARQASTFGNVTLPDSGTVTFNSDDLATSTLTITNNQALTGNLNVNIGSANTSIGNVTLSGNISGSGGGLTLNPGNTTLINKIESK